MSQPTTLIMNADQTFSTDYSDGFLPMAEWAAMNGVAERTVKRWLSADEIPNAEQRGPKRQWFIPATSMRISHEERERRAAEAEAAAGTDVAVATSTTVAVPETEFAVDEEFQEHLWVNDLAAYLGRMPAYIPVRIGAAMLGLGIGYVKANPEEFEIIHRGGPSQTDVMPKLVVLRKAGLI